MSNQRYLVAARKYRPKRFGDLVAQEHVTETLKNALRLERLSHAYLFSGPRGVGKTTAARILAKAINCTTPREERTDEAEPCRECDSCRSFEEGRSLNIFEIDAASNRKVDDIQPLLERIRVPPQGGRKKVYIIDEVHMMSKHAFNAFLKTLEEPPPHVLFIFATTEPHKVLPTILSRCQRFDFRRIPVPAIVEHLRAICEAEDIRADEASLMLVARKGDGALRDALSAFDQAVSLCGTELTYAELAQALGVVDIDLYFRLTGHVRSGSSADMLVLVESVMRTGYDLQEFLMGLAEHVRNLLVAHTTDDLALIEAAEATRRRYAEEAAAFSEADLLRLLMIAADAEEEVKSSAQPRLKLELALLKMASLTRATDLREALQKIDRLEALVQSGELPAQLPASAAPDEANNDRPRAAERAAASPSRHVSPPDEAAPPEQAANAEEDAGRAGDEAADEVSAEAAGVDATPAAEDRPAEEPPPQEGEPPAPRTVPSSDAPRTAATKETSERSTSSGYDDLFGAPALKKRMSSRESGPAASAKDAAAEDAATGSIAAATLVAPEEAPTPASGQLAASWETFVQAVGQVRIRVASLLHHTTPLRLEGGAAVVAVPDAFHRRALAEEQPLLLRHAADAFEAPVKRFQFILQNHTTSEAPRETASEKNPYEQVEDLREEHPVVRAIFEKFGGELVYR